MELPVVVVMPVMVASVAAVSMALPEKLAPP
jgi:hypothetical protein